MKIGSIASELSANIHRLQEVIMFNSRTTSTILMEISKYYELESMQVKTCRYLHLHFHASSTFITKHVKIILSFKLHQITNVNNYNNQ